MADSLLVGHTQLTQKLTAIVENFTLLDILSKEEREELLTGKIDKLKQENEKRFLRHQEVEADRVLAAGRMSSVDTRLSQEHRLERQSSSSDSSKRSQKSSPPSRGFHRGGGIGLHKGHQSSAPRSPESSISSNPDSNMPASFNRRQVSSPMESVPGMLQPNTLDIILHNHGKGLGFGIIGTPAGVNVKTILEDGVAAMEGSLRTGDTLLFVNDVDVRCMRRDEVFDILRREVGEVHLVVSRDDEESPLGRLTSSRWNDNYNNQRGGYSHPPEMEKKESLTVSIPNERATRYRGEVRGRGRGRGRGWTMEPDRLVMKMTAEQMRQQEYEEKKQQNIDLVEAEIQAMREAYEIQKAAASGGGATNFIADPPPSSGSFLYDRSRFGPDPSQSSGPQDRREGRRRTPHNWGGPTIEDVHQNINRTRKSRQFSGPHSNQEMTISMTGRERSDYEQWKNDRERADQQRLERHMNESGEWRREWDREKPNNPGRQDRLYTEGHQVSHQVNRGGRYSGRGQSNQHDYSGGGRGRPSRNHDEDNGRGEIRRGRGYRNYPRFGTNREWNKNRFNIPTSEGEQCQSPISNPMDQWEPSGGEDWETADDKILAESPSAPGEGELWKPSPNQDPLSGPIGTWEPPIEERQWEEDMENNKMSVGEKVKHWQHCGFLGGDASHKSDNCISPTAVVSSPPSGGAFVLGGASVIDSGEEASHLVKNIILMEGPDRRVGNNKREVIKKLQPLIIPKRDSNLIYPASPLSAGSLKTPPDLHVDWSVSPVDPPLSTVQEESSIYRFQPM